MAIIRNVFLSILRQLGWRLMMVSSSKAARVWGLRPGGLVLQHKQDLSQTKHSASRAQAESMTICQETHRQGPWHLVGADSAACKRHRLSPRARILRHVASRLGKVIMVYTTMANTACDLGTCRNFDYQAPRLCITTPLVLIALDGRLLRNMRKSENQTNKEWE